jgi:hypothetical protein
MVLTIGVRFLICVSVVILYGILSWQLLRVSCVCTRGKSRESMLVRKKKSLFETDSMEDRPHPQRLVQEALFRMIAFPICYVVFSLFGIAKRSKLLSF